MEQTHLGIEKITVVGQFGHLEMKKMPRNKFAYTYMHHGIDRVSFEIEFPCQTTTLAINGMPIRSNGTSVDFPLQTGVNQFLLTNTTSKAESTSITLVLFRAYATPTWEKLSDQSPWCPRDSAGEVVFNDRMWLIGGYIPQTVSDVWCTQDGLRWTQHQSVPTDHGVDIPVAVSFLDQLFVTDTIGNFYASKDGTDWRKVGHDTPFIGRRFMGGVVFRDRLYVMGGADENHQYNDVWCTQDGEHWEKVTEQAAWSKRAIHHTPLVYDEKIWLIGGSSMRDYYPFVAYNDVWYSEDGNHWVLATEAAPWPPRVWGSTTVYKNRMWLIGGYRSEPSSRHFRDCWYTTDGKQWIRFRPNAHEWINPDSDTPPSLAAPMWEDRHEMSVLSFKNSLYLFGGMIWPLKNDVWRLHIDGLCFLSQPVFRCFEHSLYRYLAFADFSPCGKPASYRLVKGPDFLTIDSKTGVLQGITSAPSTYEIIIEAYTQVDSVQQRYRLEVLAL